MIQEIAPHKFDNEYKARPPKDEDIVVLFEDNEILLKENQFFTYADLNEGLKKEINHFQYLFQMDDLAFFYLKTVETEQIEQLHATRHPFSVFRSFEPSFMAYAGIVACNLYHWYEAHKYCGHCGSVYEHSQTERALVCLNCGETSYPSIAPAVIVAITDKNKILLTKYAGREYANYALVAGYTEIGETLEETVIREVKEEVGLDVKNIRYYKNQPWPFTGTMLIGFFADLDGNSRITLQEDELKEGTWFDRDNIPPTLGTVSLTAEMIEVFRSGKEPK